MVAVDDTVGCGRTAAFELDGERRELAVEAIEECCEYAGQRGIFLGLENHGGLTATAELLNLDGSRVWQAEASLDSAYDSTVSPQAVRLLHFALQAVEAIKLLCGIGEPLHGRLLVLDALQMHWRELRLRPDPDCPVCGR